MTPRSFYESFPATAILLLTVSAFYTLEVIYHHKISENDLFQSILWLPGPEGNKVLESLGANSLPFLLEGQVWRLIAHAFLHGFFFHLLLNGLVLSDLGRLCEPLLGTERFTVAYVASAVGGGLGSAGYDYLSGRGVSSVGASGALFGLMGLLLTFGLRHRDRQLTRSLLQSIVLIVVISIAIPRVDHAGHLGGFLTGSAFGFFTPRYVTSKGARAWRIPFWLAVAATIASLGFAIWNRLGIPLR